MRIIVVGNLNNITGYGNDTLDVIRYLRAAGEDVIPIPLDLTPPIPAEVADLFTRDLFSGPADVVLGIAPCFALKPDKYVELGHASVGWTMWEQDKLLIDDMIQSGRGWAWDAEVDGVEVRNPRRWWGCDLMLVSCEDNVAAFEHLDPLQRYGVQPMGVDCDFWAEERRVPGGRLKLGVCGALTGRKGIGALIESLAKVKGRYPDFDALVELKTLPGTLPPFLDEHYSRESGVEVRIITDLWSPEQLRDWYYTLDGYVALSTGEGNNKPAMEMMSTGGFVIATDMMGHRNWLHPDCTMAIGGRYEHHTEGNPARLFRANTDQAAEGLWWLHEHPGEAAQKGRTASGWVRGILDWPVVIRQLLKTLRAEADGGQRRAADLARQDDLDRAAYTDLMGHTERMRPGETIAVGGPEGTHVMVTDPVLGRRIMALQDELMGLVAGAQNTGQVVAADPGGQRIGPEVAHAD